MDNRSSGATKVIYDANVAAASYTPAQALPLGDYRAWVRALNDAGSGPWSSAYDFTIAATVAAPPTPRSPAGYYPHGLVQGNTVGFFWDDPDAQLGQTYEFWLNDLTVPHTVSNQPNLTGLIASVPATLFEAHRYRWWVRRTNPNSDWSQGFDFTLVANTSPLGAPVLMTLRTSNTNSAYQILQWVPNGATSYEIWVNNVTTGQNKFINTAGITNTFVDFADTGLLPDGTYHAWVRGHNGYGDSAWSNKIEFSIFRGQARPAMPILLTPTNGEVTTNRRPVLSWTAVSGVQQYQFILVRYNSSEVMGMEPVNGTGVAPTSDLPTGVYGWTVQAVDANGYTSNWASAQTFTIK